MVSKFGINSVWVRVPQVAMLRTCVNMTLAVERDVNPNFDFCFRKILFNLVI